MLLGCIGDDFTGSSDLANTLAKAGMRVVQYAGVPGVQAGPEVEAGVVALKSRTVPPGEAVALSLAALGWLRRQGCRRFVFKYCSTFDSTRVGNIGPVAEALLDALGAPYAVVCPAFPATGRTVYQGHLFVGDTLLSESSMRDHPLTPMTDPDLRRWLGYQTRDSVGHVAHATVARGRDAIGAALEAARRAGQRLIVVDAIADHDLREIGRAADEGALITGGSGIALGLPDIFRAAGLLRGGAQAWHGLEGPCAILSGSCSTATRVQVAAHAARHPAREIAVDAVMSGGLSAEDVAAFVVEHAPDLPLAYSSADPVVVRAAQERFGQARVAETLEGLFGAVAAILVRRGFTRLVVAGGETSGAVVQSLGLRALAIGPEIDPGVPAMAASGGHPGEGSLRPRAEPDARRPSLVLALKSGNFGRDGFFARAAAVLGGADPQAA